MSVNTQKTQKIFKYERKKFRVKQTQSLGVISIP